MVDLNSFFNGESTLFSYTLDNSRQDENDLFERASEYGKKLLQKDEFDTIWIALFTWKNVKPNDPGDFGGVSSIFSLI